VSKAKAIVAGIVLLAEDVEEGLRVGLRRSNSSELSKQEVSGGTNGDVSSPEKLTGIRRRFAGDSIISAKGQQHVDASFFSAWIGRARSRRCLARGEFARRNPALTPKDEAFRFLSRVQYSGRQQDARSDDRDYRDDRCRPDDDRASRGTGHNGGNEGWRPGNGASFWLRVGDTRIRAKCPNGGSMRACMDTTLMLLDRAESLRPVPTEPSPSASPTRGESWVDF
jgi:hypothetical protein